VPAPPPPRPTLTAQPRAPVAGGPPVQIEEHYLPCKGRPGRRLAGSGAAAEIDEVADGQWRGRSSTGRTCTGIGFHGLRVRWVGTSDWAIGPGLLFQPLLCQRRITGCIAGARNSPSTAGGDTVTSGTVYGEGSGATVGPPHRGRGAAPGRRAGRHTGAGPTHEIMRIGITSKWFGRV